MLNYVKLCQASRLEKLQKSSKIAIKSNYAKLCQVMSDKQNGVLLTSCEGAEGGYYNSNGDWVPPEVVAMNFSNVNDHVEIDGIMYGYDTLRKEVRVSKFGSMEKFSKSEFKIR